MTYMMSFSIPMEDRQQIEAFLESQRRQKGTSKSAVVLTAVKAYMKAEQAQAQTQVQVQQ